MSPESIDWHRTCHPPTAGVNSYVCVSNNGFFRGEYFALINATLFWQNPTGLGVDARGFNPNSV